MVRAYSLKTKQAKVVQSYLKRHIAHKKVVKMLKMHKALLIMGNKIEVINQRYLRSKQ